MGRDAVKVYGGLWMRSFVIVSLTALNVVNIGAHEWTAAFVTGCGISGVWWFNTNTAVYNTVKGAWVAYMLGAGCGTVFGMWVGGI